MNDTNSLTAKLLAAMFPGSPERGVPGFVGSDLLQRLHQRSALPEAMERLLIGEAALDFSSDINILLKGLRKIEPELVSNFVEQAIMVYFSEPAVSRALTGKPSPLFPHTTTINDIDFDLLEPVLATIKGMTHG